MSRRKHNFVGFEVGNHSTDNLQPNLKRLKITEKLVNPPPSGEGGLEFLAVFSNMDQIENTVRSCPNSFSVVC